MVIRKNNKSDDGAGRPAYPLVLDVDTGRDDAWTIMSALSRFEVCAIISTFGNVPLYHTTRNSLDVLKLSKKSLLGVSQDEKRLPLWRGEKDPTYPVPHSSLQEINRRASINGNGLCNLFLPASSQKPRNKNESWEKSFKKFLLRQGPVNYVVCGPATNLANLIDEFGCDEHARSEITRYIKSVTIMGGSIHPDLPVDFNFRADPAAARKIIRTFGEKLTLVPFDETKKLLMTEQQIESLQPSNPANVFAKDLMLAHARGWSPDKTVMLHDPATLLALDGNTRGVSIVKARVSVDVDGDKPGKVNICDDGVEVRKLVIRDGHETRVRNRILRNHLQFKF